MSRLSRREVLGLLGAASLAGRAHADVPTDPADAGFPPPPEALPASDSLAGIAAARGLLFGSEVMASDLADPAYAALIARECAIITPGIEAKWPVTEPAEGRFDFTRLDTIAGFAARHGLRLHLHTLVWAVGMPPWLTRALAEGRGEAVLRRHIATLAGRYRESAHSWDVVNEPVDPRWPSAPEGLCNTPWRRFLGAEYVPLAFRLAREADPAALLMLNDDDLEYAWPDREKKRTTYLRLIESWLRQGVPIGGFGIEAHLKPDQPIAERAFRRFLAELAGFGLSLMVTELDIQDRTLPADIAARDRAVADACRRYLDLVLDERAVCGVITWGLADRFGDLDRDKATRRADGLPSRGLPFDAALRRKPMADALAEAFRHAPMR